MEAIIRIHNINKTYPNGYKALDSVSLQIAQGEFFTLLGPNGAGKSTLVKILTTIISKSSGEFSIGNKNPETDFKQVQRIIGVAGQENELDLSETVENLLRFQGRMFGLTKNQANQRMLELVQLFQLHDEKKKKAGSLSGGNKRRLHCALALVHKPKILFLDEPTTGMDPVARANFWKIIANLNQTQGVTVFLTTQYLDEADKHADSMALLTKGKISYSGSISQFKEMVNPGNARNLEESYIQYLEQWSKPPTDAELYKQPAFEHA